MYSGTWVLGSPTLGVRSLTMLSELAYTPAQPKWWVMPMRWVIWPLIIIGLKRLVITESTTAEPRLFHTRTLSPGLMPFSSASSGESSMNWVGMDSMSAGHMRVWPPVCQCSTTE